MIIIKNKKLLLILSTFLIAFLFTGCFLFNSSPIIESDPVTTAKEEVVYTYGVKATDPNEDTLTYSLTDSPTDMTINSNTGVITWTPTAAGNYDVTVKVSDGSKSATQSFTITVDEALLTSIVVLPPSMTLEIGESKPITSVTAHYDNSTEANIALTACNYDSDNPTIATVNNGVITGESAGSATITVSYTEDSITKTDTVSVIIVDEALLTSIVVLPTSVEIAAGSSKTITSVTAHYDNGTSVGIALSTCTYGSNNTSVTVANGVITVSSSCAATTATITVSYTEGGVTKSDTVTVTVPASGG